MKLIPEQVMKMTRQLEQEEQALKGYENYFSEMARINGDNNYTIDDEGNRFTHSQYHLIEQKIKVYKDALKYAERVTKIDTDKIDLGTKFILQFDGEAECELFTLVDTALGLDETCIMVDSPVGASLFHLTNGQNFSTTLENGEVISGKVMKIITNSKEYIKYINSSDKENGDFDPKKLVLTESQIKLLELEKNFVLKRIWQETNKQKQLVAGTKVTIRIGKDSPKTYTIVDKKEDKVNPECEISLNGTLINRLYSRKADGTFYIYEVKDKTSKIKKKAKLLDIIQENAYSNLDKDLLIKRLDTINGLLKNSIKNDTMNDEKTINIGTYVSIMTFDESGSHTRRVEVIQKAVSYELETDYVEASSPLGRKIMGLRENDEFIYVTNDEKYYSGIVYDIDNQKDTVKTLNPLLYQKLNK